MCLHLCLWNGGKVKKSHLEEIAWVGEHEGFLLLVLTSHHLLLDVWPVSLSLVPQILLLSTYNFPLSYA